MNIANLQLALFNQSLSAKENRLVFMAPPEAPKPVEAPKPQLDAADKEEIAPLKPEELKAKMTEKIAALNTQMDEIATNVNGEYSKKLADEVKSLRVSLDVLSSAIQAATTEEGSKEKLSDMYAATREMEKDLSDELLSLDKQTVALKKLLEEKRLQVTPELVTQKLTEMAGAQNIEIKPEDINTLNLFLEKMFTGLQDQIDAIKPASNDLIAMEFTVENLNLEGIFTNYLALISNDEGKKVLAGIAEISQMQAKSPEAKKLQNDAIVDFVGQVISGQEDSITPEVIAETKASIEKADGIDKVSDSLYEKIAALLKFYKVGLEGKEITAEMLKTAITTYEPGKDENGTQSEDSKKLIKLILDSRKVLEENGVRIDFMGGTDGSNHGLIRNAEWHKAKAKALTKFLALQAAGNLEGSSIASPELELVNKYIEAANKGKGYEFVRDSGADKGSFLNGQGIFDKALAIQRADNAKKQIEGASYEPITAKDKVSLEIGANAGDVNQRKSGIRLREIEKNPTIGFPDTITMTPSELADVLGPIRKWKKNPDHPSQKGKGKETDPGECSEDGKTGRNYNGPGDKDYDYYQKGDDGVWKKILLEAADAPAAPEVVQPTSYIYEVKDDKLEVKETGKNPVIYNIIKPDNVVLKPGGTPPATFVEVFGVIEEGTEKGAFSIGPKGEFRTSDIGGGPSILGTHTMTLDSKTKTIEIKAKPAAKEVKNEKDHAYSINKGGVLEVTFNGETKSTQYNTWAPDGFTGGVETKGTDSFIRVNSADGSQSGWFEFNKDKALRSGPTKGKINLWESYKINLEDNTIRIVEKTADEKVKDKCTQELSALSKKYGVKDIFTWNNREYDYNDVLKNIASLDSALSQIKESHPHEFVKLKEVTIALLDQALKNGLDTEGLSKNAKGDKVIAVDYDEDAEDIEKDILGALKELPATAVAQPAAPKPAEAVESSSVYDEAKTATYSAMLMKEIDDLDLDFIGVFGLDNKSRQDFVDKTLLLAKKLNIEPKPGLIKACGFKNGDGVEYGASTNTDPYDLKDKNPAFNKVYEYLKALSQKVKG